MRSIALTKRAKRTAARTTDAIEAFRKEGMFKQLLQRIQGQPQNEAIEAMKKIVAVLNNDVIDAYKLNAEFSEMLTQQKEQLAHSERAAAREDAAQRKLGGLNLSIFVLDGALSLFDVKPTAK
jgi:transposase